MKKLRRIIAIYIDFVIAFSCVYYPLKIIDNVFNDIIIIKLIITIISLYNFYFLMVFKDLLFKNASVGKRIMKLKIYHNGKIPDKNIIIKRNKATSYVYPIYIFQIIFANKSYGDIKYNTEVR